MKSLSNGILAQISDQSTILLGIRYIFRQYRSEASEKNFICLVFPKTVMIFSPKYNPPPSFKALPEVLKI